MKDQVDATENQKDAMNYQYQNDDSEFEDTAVNKIFTEDNFLNENSDSP